MIKDMHKEERPRERLIKYGVNSLSNEELISIIIRTGTKGESVKDLSKNILKLFENINDLKNLDINMLTKVKGVGKVKAIEIISSLELGRRVYLNTLEDKEKIKNGEDIYNLFKNIIKDNNQEHFYALYLDTKKNVLGIKHLFIGTVNMSTVHPREIFKYAYLYSASYIVCVHNHPTGDVTPSDVDISLTNNLIDIGNIQKIPILDHLIIGNNNYFSFYEKNII
ncbi:MAG: DNA repair protein RadC [Bacilli bacterium]|nr:DNA repair protein RadC [Bacilli bacterium]